MIKVVERGSSGIGSTAADRTESPLVVDQKNSLYVDQDVHGAHPVRHPSL